MQIESGKECVCHFQISCLIFSEATLILFSLNNCLMYYSTLVCYKLLFQNIDILTTIVTKIIFNKKASQPLIKIMSLKFLSIINY